MDQNLEPEIPQPAPREITLNRVLRWIIVGLSIAAVLYTLWYFIDLVAYILIAVVFSLIGKPLMNFFEKVHIGKLHSPEWLNAAVTILILWGVILGSALMVVPLVGSTVQSLSNVDSTALLNSLQEPIDNLVRWLEAKNIHFNSNVSLEEYIESEVSKVLKLDQFSNLFGTVFSFLGDLGVAFFSISFITFFFLRDNTLFYKSIMSATPTKYEVQVKNVIRESSQLLTRYFIGIAIQVLLITLCVTIGALICGLPLTLAITMGLAAGFFNIIPYVGPMIGTAFGILLAISYNIPVDFYTESLPLIFKLLVVYGITQLLDNILFQPLIFSKSVKAHPLELFLVIIIAGNLGGMLGMILAIPGYTFIRVIAKEFFSNFKIVQSLTKNI